MSDLIQDALDAGQSTATLFLLADDNDPDITSTFHTRHYTPSGGAQGAYGATLTIGDPIPEPGTVLLVVTGMAVVLGACRRRRSRR